MKMRLIILTMLSLMFGMTSMAQKTIRYDLVKIIFEDGSEQKAQGYVFVTFKNNYKSFYISNHKGTRAKGHDLEGFYSGYSSKKFPGATGAFAIEDCTFYDPVDFSYVKKIGSVNIYKAKRTIRQAVSHGMNFIVEPTKCFLLAGEGLCREGLHRLSIRPEQGFLPLVHDRQDHSPS